MEHLTRVAQLRETLGRHRRAGQRIALVPTMGNLHTGHVHLVEEAAKHGDIVVCSIFVNPMQFGRNEDLDAYPRTLEADIAKLRQANCDVLFAPDVAEVYPLGINSHTTVSVPRISERHCGASRPGHFDGVATVVAKLFNLVQPDVALFGLKDYQQLMVIRKMVADLCFPLELIGVPTQRAADGLALSSRNGYLSEEERARAPMLHRSLLNAAEQLQQGAPIAEVEANARATLTAAGFRPDYFNVAHATTLEPADPRDSQLVILAAAWLGTTRLIDNLPLTTHNKEK